jgi:hypothetical protein
MSNIISNTNTGSNLVLLGYIEVILTWVNRHTHTSSSSSTGKLRFHLVGRFEKRVNS